MILPLHEYYVYVRTCLECIVHKAQYTTCALKLACSPFCVVKALSSPFYIGEI